MLKRSRLFLAVVALLSYTALPAPLLAGGSAAWYYNFVGPTEYQAGYWYDGPSASPTNGGITVAGGVPSNAVVTTVAWHYTVSRSVANQLVYLCRKSDGACINISASPSGNSNNFAGDSANDTFWIQFGIAGSGTLSPPIQCGYSDQFIINYSY